MDERTALVVDDDEGSARALARMLRLDGWAVTVCLRATEAARLLQTMQYDALITDLEMPDMTGIELLRLPTRVASVRQSVVVSGAPPDLHADTLVALGVPFLRKPVDYDALAALVSPEPIVVSGRRRRGSSSSRR
jgi:two-component system, NtrC family, response regulator AtoC